MGLVVDLREKMTSMSPSHPSIGGRSHSNNNHNQHNLHQHHHLQGEQVVRKKRTFDIAFLTGQSEQKVTTTLSSSSSSSVLVNSESNNNNSDHNLSSSKNKRYSSPSSISYLTSLPSEDGSPFNLTQDGTNYSSDTSSMIDVMTNGSLSESESSPASSPRIGPTPTHPVILKSNKGKGSSSSSLGNNNGRNPGRISSTRNLVKEEIRFESKRTIDINHTSDSLKIKENLRFSTSIPSISPGSIPSSDGSNGDLTLPHMTFALFPRFPMGIPMGLSQNNHIANEMASSGMSFTTAKMMEKCEGINLSYHHHHNNNNNNHPLALSKLRGGFPDHPYAHAAAAAAMAGGYPYPNLIIPHELQHRHPQFSPGHGSSMGGGGGGNSIAVGQPSPPGMNHPGGGVTLLPPSLTALTLPAQNVCAKCNIGFRMTSDLVYHMRSHHKRDSIFDPLKKQREEKLKCPVCHETFRERHHLTRHMTAHQDRAEEKIEGAAIAAAAAASVVAAAAITVKK